jgi:simple sugar transport system permease protein
LFGLLLLNLIISPEFFSLEIKDGRLYGSLIDVLNRAAPVALLAIGMSLIIATGGVDLSVGSVMAIAGAVSATMISYGVESLPLVILGGIAAGVLAGLINGALVAYLGVQPIVATLIFMVAGRGVAQLINAGKITTFHHAGFEFLGRGYFIGIPMPIIIVLLTLILVLLLLHKTALGLYIEAVGTNARASRFVGLDQRAIKLFVYTVSGFCASLAGMIAAADIGGSDANNTGLWLELDAILAVVIGGASLMGGRFSVSLSVIGALIIQALAISIILSGISAKFNLLIKAIVIIFILLIQSPILHAQIRRFNGMRTTS